MRKYTVHPEDVDAPPSPLFVNYVEFKGEHLTPEERAELFSSNPIWLRRVVELAQQREQPLTFRNPSEHDQPTTKDRRHSEMHRT